MTAAARDFDPYLLPLPTPASPVVLPHLAGTLHAHLNGRYANPVWPLAPLTDNPSTRKPASTGEHWPAAFRDEMRLAAWNLINGQLRPTFLQEHGVQDAGAPQHDGGQQHAGAVEAAREYGSRKGESAASPIAPPASCTTTACMLATPASSRKRVLVSLVSLTRLWALDQLSARPNGIGRPSVGRPRPR